MKIIDSFIKSKTGKISDCEDAIFLNDFFACVIDGATSKSKLKWNGRTSGQKAVELMLNEITHFSEDIDCKAAIGLINNSIKNYYNKQGVYSYVEKFPHERLIGSLVIYSDKRHEIWQIGDCPFMIDTFLKRNNKKVDEILSSVRSLFIELNRIEGKNVDELMEEDQARNYILPLLKKQSLLQNREGSQYSYTVIDGFDIDYKGIVHKVPHGTKHVILASDGYPELKSSLEESERYLYEVLKEDPLCYTKNKSTKGLKKGNLSFDDRAYLKVLL